MQSQNTHPDFVLFPPESQNQFKMLALEPSRQQQFPYFQSYTMDPAFIDPFGLQVDQLGGFAQNQDPSRVPHSYYDTPPVYAESGPDMNKQSMLSTTPPSMTTSQPAEHSMPGLSSASGPSIASASSSAIGSPYSGNVQPFPENWVDTNHGLGLQAAVVGDMFPNDYMGGSVDPEGLYPKKTQDNYVGESQDISSNIQSPFPFSPSHHESSLSSPFVTTSEQKIEPLLDNSTRVTPAPFSTSCDSSVASITPVSQSTASHSPGARSFASPSTPASSRRSASTIHSPISDVYKTSLSTKATHRSPTFSRKSSSPSMSPSLFPGSFFQQSSGNFVPPLESSCRFSLYTLL